MAERILNREIFNYIEIRVTKQMLQTAYDIDCVFDGLDGKGAIYVSNYESACLKSIREKHNIRAVISIASGAYVDYHDELIQYIYIPAKDTDAYQISKHFQETNNFLNKHRKCGNVLVHCMVGKSRSATIVAAYLLNKFRYSLPTVMQLLRRKRKKINPNPGFMKQLEEYCDQIGVDKGSEKQKCTNAHRSFKSQIATSSQKTLTSTIYNLSHLSMDSDFEESRQRIASKIQQIRQKYQGTKIREKAERKKLYHSIKPLETSESASLSSNVVEADWTKTKSVELS